MLRSVKGEKQETTTKTKTLHSSPFGGAEVPLLSFGSVVGSKALGSPSGGFKGSSLTLGLAVGVLHEPCSDSKVHFSQGKNTRIG